MSRMSNNSDLQLEQVVNSSMTSLTLSSHFHNLNPPKKLNSKSVGTFTPPSPVPRRESYNL